MRVAARIQLSPEEQAYLVGWAGRDVRVDDRALRARIVLLAAEGRQDLEIAHELRINRLTAARWRRRFLTSRLPALDRGPGSVERGARLPDEKIRAIVRSGRRPERPSTRTAAEALGVSHSTVRRVWATYGLPARRFAGWSGRPDPVPALVPTDVIGLWLHPPGQAVVFALGPAGVPAEERHHPPDLGFTIPSGLERLWNVPGQMVGPGPARSDRELLRFLGRVVGSLGPGRSARLVVAAADGEPSGALARWAARHPQLACDVVLPGPAWTARILPIVQAIGRGPEGGRRFAARGELARAFRLFLASYREEAGPFEWVASAKDVARGEAIARLRYALSVTGHAGFKSAPAAPSAMSAAARPDPRAREMARMILRRSLRVRRGERVTIEAWSQHLDFANALVLESVQLGARPLLLYRDEPTYWAAASRVPASNLAHIGEHTKAALERSDVFVSFFGPSDRERYHALPRVTRNRLGEYQDELLAAASKAGSRAVLLALGRVSEPSARMYGVDLDRWRNELIEGSLIDPARLDRRARALAERLRTGRTLRIRHPNGTDLRLGLKHRTPEVSNGRVPPATRRSRWELVQLPAGVVTVALDEAVAEGVFVSNVPNSIGVMDAIGEIAGGRWTFADGRLVRYTYERGGEIVDQSYRRGGPGKDRPGTLSIGLNERLEVAPLLMDQALGTLTLQVGRNDTAGGTNHVYWWAWLLLRGADLSVDGAPLVHGGRLGPAA